MILSMVGFSPHALFCLERPAAKELPLSTLEKLISTSASSRAQTITAQAEHLASSQLCVLK